MRENILNRLNHFHKKHAKHILKTILAAQILAIGSLLLVGTINYIDHGISGALIGGLKQYVYTSLSSFFLVPVYDVIAHKVKKRSFQEIYPVIIPSVTSICFTYIMHYSLIRTPEAFLSTLPVIVFTPLSFSIWHFFRMKNECQEPCLENGKTI